MLLAYGYWVHPAGFGRGYAEDMCFPDFARQIMADQLRIHGRPSFVTDLVMTPAGASIPYMSWSIERDWLGAYFWNWNRDFPFLWFYFCVSLAATYAGVGFILRKMGLGRLAAWGIALAAVGFHVPRHFKIWHHYEHLLQHWVYWGFFLDAWILQRFWRERKLSWNLEAWRALVMLGMLGTVGYFWGPMILEWGLVRLGLAAGLLWARFHRTKIAQEWEFRRALLPAAIAAVLIALDLRWYPPLFEEVKKLGEVPQVLSWFAERDYLPRPLWLGTGAGIWKLAPLDRPETVVTIGWFYWVPLLLSVWLVRRRAGGPGLRILAPFLGLLLIAFLYMGQNPWPLDRFQAWVQAVVPFMSFFRVASRWGLFLPQIACVMVVLAWPELREWVRARQHRLSLRVALGLFLVTSLVEFSWLLYPVNAMPPLAKPVVSMLEKIRELPGESVLNLPFCVTGGNGVCSEQCPNYPGSTTGMCLRTWHDKKIYGLYASRLMFSDCEIYRRAPFTSWFEAWRQQRCLSDPEWDEFCGYLKEHSEIAAVLVHPELWHAAGTPECRQKLEARLGPPLGEGSYPIAPTRGGQGAWPSRIIWYSPRCAK